MLRAELIAAAHQQRRADDGERKRDALPLRRRAVREPQAVSGEDEAARYCRTGSRCRAWSCGCPRSRRRGRAHRRSPRSAMVIDQRAPRPMRPAARSPGAISNRNGSASASRQKPAATGPTSDKPHQPRPEGQARHCRAAARERRGGAVRRRGGSRGSAHSRSAAAAMQLGRVLLAQVEQGERRPGRGAALVELARDRSGRSPAPRSRQ